MELAEPEATSPTLPVTPTLATTQGTGTKRSHSPLASPSTKKRKIDSHAGTEPAHDLAPGASAPSSPGPGAGAEASLEDDITLYPEDIKLGSISRLAVERPHPLTCPNQDIVRPLGRFYVIPSPDSRSTPSSQSTWSASTTTWGRSTPMSSAIDGAWP